MNNKNNLIEKYVNFILNSDEKTFHDIMNILENKSNSIDFELFKALDLMFQDFQENSEKYLKAKKVLQTRNLEALKSSFAGDDFNAKKIIDRIFEILSNDELLYKFLEYDNNIETFSIDGHPIQIENYLLHLNRIFSEDSKYGILKDKNKIIDKFYIPDIDLYLKRCSKIFDTINPERYLNPSYTFKIPPHSNIVDRHIKETGDEPDWNISPELKNCVFRDMPKEFSLEEQAVFIYCNLCKELSYDDNYLYKDYGITNPPSPFFSKETLENIVPGSKVTCWDFSRILSKFINDLDGDIHSVIISDGKDEAHFFVGFYSNRVSATLEAIDLYSHSSNDLMKAKNRIQLEGIEAISDKYGILKKSIEKVYPIVFKSPLIPLDDYISKLKEIPKTDIPNNLEAKLNSFIQAMNSRKITGDEAVQTFTAFHHFGYFGESLDRAFIGKLTQEENKGKSYRRMILIRPHSKSKAKPGDVLYLLNSDPLELSTIFSEDIVKNLNSGLFVYENKRHKIPGIYKEI